MLGPPTEVQAGVWKEARTWDTKLVPVNCSATGLQEITTYRKCPLTGSGISETVTRKQSQGQPDLEGHTKRPGWKRSRNSRNRKLMVLIIITTTIIITIYYYY